MFGITLGNFYPVINTAIFMMLFSDLFLIPFSFILFCLTVGFINKTDENKSWKQDK